MCRPHNSTRKNAATLATSMCLAGSRCWNLSRVNRHGRDRKLIGNYLVRIAGRNQ
jgi:hypothetical protein